MKKRKIAILIVSFLFFASTTGLPITIHLCKMVEPIGTEECSLHYNPVKSSCCDEKNNGVIFNSVPNPNCCVTKTIDNSIADNYLAQKIEINSDLTFTSLILNNDLYNYKSFTNKFFGYSDTSPPSLNNNYLYLTNSSLLI